MQQLHQEGLIPSLVIRNLAILHAFRPRFFFSALVGTQLGMILQSTIRLSIMIAVLFQLENLLSLE
jgi:hypothetical protein